MILTNLPRHPVTSAMASRVSTGGTQVTVDTFAGVLAFEVSPNRATATPEVFRGGRALGPLLPSVANVPFWYKVTAEELILIPQPSAGPGPVPTMDSGAVGRDVAFRLPFEGPVYAVPDELMKVTIGRTADSTAFTCAFWDSGGDPYSVMSPDSVFVVGRAGISGNIAIAQAIPAEDRSGAYFSLVAAGDTIYSTALVTFNGSIGPMTEDGEFVYYPSGASLGGSYPSGRSLGVGSFTAHSNRLFADLGVRPAHVSGEPVRFVHPGGGFYPAFGLWLHGLDPTITYIRIPLQGGSGTGEGGVATKAAIHVALSPQQVGAVLREVKKSASTDAQAQFDGLISGIEGLKPGSVVRASMFPDDVGPFDIVEGRILTQAMASQDLTWADIKGEKVQGTTIEKWRADCLARSPANALVWVESGAPARSYRPAVVGGEVVWSPSVPEGRCFCSLAHLTDEERVVVEAWLTANEVEIAPVTGAALATRLATTDASVEADMHDVWWRSYGFRNLRGLAAILIARTVIPRGTAQTDKAVSRLRLQNVPLGDGSYIRQPVALTSQSVATVPLGYNGVYVTGFLQHDTASWSGTGGRAFGFEVWRDGSRVSPEVVGVVTAGARLRLTYAGHLACQPGDELRLVYASTGTAEAIEADVTLLSL